MPRPHGPVPADATTTALHLLVEEWRTRHGEVAQVDGPEPVDPGTEGLGIYPHADGAVEVDLWHGAEGLHLSIGGSPGWDLPRNSSSVDTVRAVAAAAVEGRIEVGRGGGLTRYRVTLPDGAVVEDDAADGFWHAMLFEVRKPRRLAWTTSAPYEPPTA
ncbi:hypothetical protein [Cellulomonas dongxiuzhuiae]|uniref:Uncharacterized protein n=1 Tax=Cellulomonas dongxiuzhuiae TaxID=2819979 RepID=A0ABX8GH97_9CELL|nr:hypothetical protein [Cellulomonas dongxiuzhuiae]MBO3094498.1 hypothetical protein [Cellulomonas dongxiuzhuiae]QWC15522.1 hypothetical protein KKR89_14665 [Cellulomonas dongxiuzhuiae]